MVAGCMAPPQMPKIARPRPPVDTVAKTGMGKLTVQLAVPAAGRRILATYADMDNLLLDVYDAADDPENNPSATPIESQSLVPEFDFLVNNGANDPDTGRPTFVTTLDPITIDSGRTVIVVLRAMANNPDPGPPFLIGMATSNPTVVAGNTNLAMRLNLIEGAPGSASLTPQVTIVNGL